MNYLKIIAVILTITAFSCQDVSKESPSKDSAKQIAERRKAERSDNLEIEKKIDELIAEMTLEEKVGQMIQIAIDSFSDIKEYNETESGITEITLNKNRFLPFLKKYPIGALINGYGFSPENWYEFHLELQQLNHANTRLKIPILHSADHQHGANYVHGATIFPHSLNMAATFNRELTKAEGRIVGLETAHLGHRWILGPLCDVGVNPFWPRIFETYGEDTYLSRSLVKSYLKGRALANEIHPEFKQASCAKHFVGYSNPTGTWDRTPADISEQTLHELHYPPFKTFIQAGGEAIMLNSGEVNGHAIHASYYYSTQVLRDQLGFTGVVISDWDDINKLWKYHKVAANAKEATLLAVNAGIDITMAPYTLEFGDYVMELLTEGRISEDRINLSVARILRMKFQMGLMDNPLSSNENLGEIGKPEHKDFAKQATEESLVLLKNEGVLPLKANSKIVLAGQNANIKRSLTGGWTYRWWPQTDAIYPEEMHTVYTALQAEFGKQNIKLSNVVNLQRDAQKADVIVLALGEMPHAEGFGNTNDLALTSEQQELVELAIKLNKPMVIVMIGARPSYITEGFDAAKAFVWAGLPGIYGGESIAGILSGIINPSGRLSFSYPATTTHYFNYNHKPTHSHYDIPPQNGHVHLAMFGEGLSYSEFKYSNLNLSDTLLQKDGSITATVTVTNTSNIDGKEAVLWYLTDEVASITRPVKALKYFEKTKIGAGESQTFTFSISSEMLGFPDRFGKQIIEQGYFTLQVGGLTQRFMLVK